MRRMIFISLLTSILLLLITPISSAQSKKVSHHIDLLGTNSWFNLVRLELGEQPLAGISGYHFTTLEMKRFNTLGLGMAWLGVNSTDTTSSYQDIAIITPLVSIRMGGLSSNDKESPNAYFNINYGYGLIHKRHELFMGISLGTGR